MSRDSIRVGAKGDPVTVEVSEAFGYEGFWNVTIWRRDSNMGCTIQPEMPTLEAATALAEKLYEALCPAQVAMEEESARRRVEFDQRAAERAERERPERERLAREREQAIQAALDGPTAEVAKCDSCGHLAEEQDFAEPVYECSGCGQSGRGEDGRRCPNCNRFTAKVAEWSCPDCEQPQEGEALTLVEVYRLPDGELVEVEQVEQGGVAPVVDL